MNGCLDDSSPVHELHLVNLHASTTCAKSASPDTSIKEIPDVLHHRHDRYAWKSTLFLAAVAGQPARSN